MLYAAAARSVRLISQSDCVVFIYCLELVAAVMHLGRSPWFRVDNEANPDFFTETNRLGQKGTPLAWRSHPNEYSFR